MQQGSYDIRLLSPPPHLPQTDQGIKNILASDAEVLAGRDPDYSIRDLFESIAKGNFVSCVCVCVFVCVCLCVCVCVCA